MNNSIWLALYTSYTSIYLYFIYNYSTKDISLYTPEVWNEDAAERDTHWIAVPPEFEQDIIQNAPYIEITYDKKYTDKIVGVNILPRPEPTPQPYQPNYNDKLLLASIS